MVSPAISGFVFKRRNKISNAKINKNAEIGSPWRAPLPSIKYFVILPPLMTRDSRSFRSFYSGRQNSWVTIKKMRSWNFNKGSASPSITHIQFVLMTNSMCIYCSQGSRFKLRKTCYWFWSAKEKTIWARANVYCIHYGKR